MNWLLLLNNVLNNILLLVSLYINTCYIVIYCNVYMCLYAFHIIFFNFYIFIELYILYII
jgi:hypothetical protein